ncbi:uncharacterized protein MYCFIDRAFT_140868 [Pseudocercospora fijiensis CIRAD86]|uniref:N-acetyltransferase domain-containing protein n=1 Tax=Pseudocercospora fijiensis (strain CIRAD86) TaxID=383855 RepID=M3A9H1_PSEFD|nr:uncharacterized protein MYCFIDRAFT_140868 [Pseudocercospora fijiensis CIRAD86]EME81266.1 hypothetical protein MYCFIDRAFT_140868 [Pseudocercospora fijiensis CIRAD86]
MPPAIASKTAADEANPEQLVQPRIVTFETERLQMKTMSMDDVDGILPILQHESVMQWTSHPPVQNRDQAARWVSSRALGRHVFNFCIREKSPCGAATASSRIVGMVGAFHWPMVGYMIHPDLQGKGYATEALKAFIPRYWERVPEGTAGGHDVLEGYTDSENFASHRILEKCRFTRCEISFQDFESPSMGLRDSVAFRLARPGKMMADLGLDPDAKEEEPPEPPVQ